MMSCGGGKDDVMATVPNFLICEGGHKLGQGLFNTPLTFKDGFIELPTEPGLGVDMEDAAIEAEVLVWANLRGIDSHGVLRIPWYLDSMEKGEMNPRPNIQTIKETAAVVYLEADRAFGPVVTVAAMKKVVEKAR